MAKATIVIDDNDTDDCINVTLTFDPAPTDIEAAMPKSAILSNDFIVALGMAQSIGMLMELTVDAPQLESLEPTTKEVH